MQISAVGLLQLKYQNYCKINIILFSILYFIWCISQRKYLLTHFSSHEDLLQNNKCLIIYWAMEITPFITSSAIVAIFSRNHHVCKSAILEYKNTKLGLIKNKVSIRSFIFWLAFTATSHFVNILVLHIIIVLHWFLFSCRINFIENLIHDHLGSIW